MKQEIKCKNSSEAVKFIHMIESIKEIKTNYFNKWYSMFIEMEKQGVQLGSGKQYLQVINSDIICTVSNLDTIFNDVCNYLEDRESTLTSIKFLCKNHFFSLLTIIRPVILHTAHINLYFKLKDKVENLSYDIFKHKPTADKTKIKEGDKTILDALARMIDIYKFDSNEKIYILSQIVDDVKKLLNTSKITDSKKVKFLEECIKNEHPATLKDREIEVLYETTSKTFHRQEVLMLFLHVVLIKNYNSGNVVNDIFRIIQLGVFLFGLQLKIFLELIDNLDESRKINEDLGNLMKIEPRFDNGVTS